MFGFPHVFLLLLCAPPMEMALFPSLIPTSRSSPGSPAAEVLGEKLHSGSQIDNSTVIHLLPLDTQLTLFLHPLPQPLPSRAKRKEEPASQAHKRVASTCFAPSWTPLQARSSWQSMNRDWWDPISSPSGSPGQEDAFWAGWAALSDSWAMPAHPGTLHAGLQLLPHAWIEEMIVTQNLGGLWPWILTTAVPPCYSSEII